MNIRKIFSQARRGTLPSDFDNWSLTDNQGRPVAHVAAINGHLPDDFNQWDLTDHGEVTVRDEYEYYRDHKLK